MVLIAVLPDASAEVAAAAVQNGADSLLVRKPGALKSKSTLAQTLGVADSIPCGAEVAGAAGADGAGWDFAVLDMSDPIGGLMDADDLDTALRLEADPPDSFLRTLDGLPVDLAFLPEPPSSLTLQALLPYYRVSRATSKPVLASLAIMATQALPALRDAGIVGVLVTVESAAKAKALADVRKAIDEMTPKKSKANRRRPVAALGSLGQVGSSEPSAPDQEDEDDFEDD